MWLRELEPMTGLSRQQVDAMKIVVDSIGRKAVQALRKRADLLADLGAEG